MKAPDAPPVIESERQAVAFGAAMHIVLHFDADWCRRVFNGDPSIHYNTGRVVLNNEIASMWCDYWTNDEKLKILAHYTATVLDR